MKDVIAKMETCASFLKQGILTVEEAEDMMNNYIHEWEDQNESLKFDTYFMQKIKLNLKKWKILTEATERLLKH